MTSLSDVEAEVLDIWDDFRTETRSYLNRDGEISDYEPRKEQREGRLQVIQPLISEFIAGDIELLDFRKEIAAEAQQYNYWGFSGVSQMFFNMLCNTAERQSRVPSVTDVLQRVFSVPNTPAEAKTQITQLEEIVTDLKTAAENQQRAPQPGYIPAYLSFFWHAQQPDAVPIYYQSAREVYADLAIWRAEGDIATDYERFWDTTEDIRSLINSKTDDTPHLWEIEYALLNYKTSVLDGLRQKPTPGTPGLYLMPVGENWLDEFAATVDSPVEIDHETAPAALQDIQHARLWGITRGTRNHTVFETLEPDDIVLFYHDTQFFATGRVEQTFTDDGGAIGDYIWSNPDSIYNYTLKDYHRLTLSKQALWEKLGYDDSFAVQGFKRVSDDRLDDLIAESGDLWSYVTEQAVNQKLETVLERATEPQPGPEDATYFILRTGSDQYEDKPTEEYHFKEGIPGSRQLRTAAGNAYCVYLEDGEFYARAKITGVQADNDTDTTQYYATIEEYEEFTPISFDDVRDALSPDFPVQYGIIKITEEDYNILAGQDITPAIREDLQALLTREANQAELYREAAAHLVAGKNIVFYGPPGTGKTRAAELLGDAICHDVSLVTANAEWSNYDVVGGYAPSDSDWTANPGFLTQAARTCAESLTSHEPRPSWLIIDELNRANLDQAFGDVFTLLDLDYRDTKPLTYASQSQHVPLSFRILATMNTYDQAQLFSLGYAFRRRFAFINVPSLLQTASQTVTTSETAISEDPIGDLQEHDYDVIELIQDAVTTRLTTDPTAGVIPTDTACILPNIDREDIENALTALATMPHLQTGEFNWLETIYHFASETVARDIVDIGQALLIDTATYLTAYYLLFPEDLDRAVMDQALVAYLVPQFEHFLPELRRADTINRDSDAPERFDELVELTDGLGLPRTATALRRAATTQRILE